MSAMASRARAKGERSNERSGNTGVALSVVASRLSFIAVVVCLLLFGLVMLYSASSIKSFTDYGDYTTIFSKQLIFVAIGTLVALIVALIPYEKFGMKFSLFSLTATIPFLIMVLVLGSEALGAKRWIDLGFATLQPSEFTKIAMMLVMVHLVERCRNHGYSLALIVFMIIACVVPIGLIIVEPDLGTTLISIIGILAVLWFGGIPKRVVGILSLGVLILGIVAIFGTGFRSDRIVAWLDPWADPTGVGYQTLNSYYAFGEGGIFGVGLGLSKQKFSWLPQSENDFLFAIVGEELGLIGALVVVALFMGLIITSLRIARNAPTASGAMIAGASGVIIGGQAFLNMLVVVGGMPTTGKPLPFFSAGGSSIIATMLLVGLILSVSRQSQEANVYDFRREQFSLVEGGALLDGARSVLSRLPNPAAAVAGAVRPKPQTNRPQVARSQSGRTAQSSRTAQAGRGQMGREQAAPARQSGKGSMAPVRQSGRAPTTPARQAGSRTVASLRSPAGARATHTSIPSMPRTSAPARQSLSRIPHAQQSTRMNSEKIIPISRGRAEKSAREAQAMRQGRDTPAQTGSAHRPRAESGLSMASLRRNRVRRSGGVA